MKMVTLNKPRGVDIGQWMVVVARFKRDMEGLVRVHAHTGDVQIVPSAHNIGVLDGQGVKHDIEPARPSGGLPVEGGEFLDAMRATTPPPYAHQIEAFRMMAQGGAGFGLFLDPGTGKTKVALNFATHHLEGDNIDCVLVCAPKGVHAQWVHDQIPVHAPGFILLSRCWGGGSVTSDSASPPLIFTINYEALLTLRGRNAVEEFLGDRRFMLILDESHRCKNPSTLTWQRAKGLSARKTCMYRLLMTGTPVSKSPLDIWAQMNLIDESIIGHRYKTTFVNEYCRVDKWHKVVGARNEDRLRGKVAGHHLRVSKDDLEDIPPKVHSTLSVEMSKKQSAAYHDTRRELVERIEQLIADEARGHAALGPSLIRLQQIANGYMVDAEGVVHRFNPNPRLSALKDFLAAETGQAIIWCRFREDVRQVVERLDDGIEMPVALPHCGDQSSAERTDNLDAWLRGNAPYLVATPDTAGTGLNLQTSGCSLAVYYSTSENAVLRWQSEDRLARLGQRGDYVRYVDIVARGTRDAAILANLRRKKSLSQTTLPELRSQLLID